MQQGLDIDPSPDGLVFIYTQTPGRWHEAFRPDAKNTLGGPPLPSQHGVEQDSQAPDITCCIVALPLQDLEEEQAWSGLHWTAPLQSRLP